MGSLTPELSLSVGLIFSQRQLSKVQARSTPNRFSRVSLPRETTQSTTWNYMYFPFCKRLSLVFCFMKVGQAFPFDRNPGSCGLSFLVVALLPGLTLTSGSLPRATTELSPSRCGWNASSCLRTVCLSYQFSAEHAVTVQTRTAPLEPEMSQGDAWRRRGTWRVHTNWMVSSVVNLQGQTHTVPASVFQQPSHTGICINS